MKKTFLLLWLIIGLSPVALAGLGGGVDSFQDHFTNTSIRHASAASASSTPVNYSVHQIIDNSGNLITEYVNADGIVFALTWQGSFKPDLHQLLGDYFKTYVAVEGASSGRQSKMIQQSQVVVVSEGRLRNFHGKAYIPRLVPSNFSPDTLK
jgi:hypothetical protein